MNLFDSLVDEALKNQEQLTTLRVVVEKELLHHDILQVLSQHHFLSDLTFIGGTCLRSCYGGVRLSEDLDFTGGADFSRESLSSMGEVLKNSLRAKYGLEVTVHEPIKDKKNVDTWKIKVETRPEKKHFPAQRINIDICSVPSYEKRSMILLNPYGVDMGTSGLVLQVQSCEEIYADKLLAFALRPNRIKYRDLWDILWLHQKQITPSIGLVPEKLKDRHLGISFFLDEFKKRYALLNDDASLEKEFKKEMRRFLSPNQVSTVIEKAGLWEAMLAVMSAHLFNLQDQLS